MPTQGSTAGTGFLPVGGGLCKAARKKRKNHPRSESYDKKAAAGGSRIARVRGVPCRHVSDVAGAQNLEDCETAEKMI